MIDIGAYEFQMSNSFTFYQDADGDGFGKEFTLVDSCTAPDGYVTNNLDCDDNNPLINPNTFWYEDADHDGFGGMNSVTSCNAPLSYVLNNEDCDDNNPLINPDAIDICNGLDDNCNGEVDENLPDSDHDGVIDCLDGCPNDPNKSTPGDCGCGVIETPTCGDACLGLPDSDCDGVGDACDICPGGNDKIDINHDGKPDCKYPPTLAEIPAAWKCGKGDKVYVCHNSNTLCVSYNALSAHLSHGDYLGPCNNAACSNSIISNPTFNNNLYSNLHDDISGLLYPNPSTYNITADINNLSPGIGYIEIIDITGKRIRWEQKEFIAGKNIISLSVQNLLPGLHFLRIMDSQKNQLLLKLNKM